MRRDLEPMVEKTLYPADRTQPGVTSLLNVLRTVFALRQIQLNDEYAFIIRDTAENVALAERLVEIIGTVATPEKSWNLSLPGDRGFAYSLRIADPDGRLP